MGNFANCLGVESVSDCLHPIISKYPILPHAFIPVVRAIGSVSHNFENLHIATCFVRCVCNTGRVLASPRYCLSFMRDDCGSYDLPYSAQTAAIPHDSRLVCFHI